MKMNHWNLVERKKIDTLRHSNPQQALFLYEKYLEKYPTDYEAKLMYITTLITLKEFDLAHELLKEVKHEYKHNKNIDPNSDTRELLDKITTTVEARYLS